MTLAERLRLTVDDVLPSDGLGAFSLSPASRKCALFLPLSRQRDLGVPIASTIVIAGSRQFDRRRSTASRHP
jgi:hypothetical protein